VAPHVHIQNAAELVIQTFKNHFVAILCATDKQFPLHLWDRLIPQAVLTLNLLRQSRVSPKISAHAQLQGPFDYNTTPLAHQEQKQSSMKSCTNEDHGHHMDSTDGILAPPWSTIVPIEYIVQPRDTKESVTR
jgi:hypothetical protein